MSDAATAPAALTRAAFHEREGGPAAAPPVRIVHLGLGGFHRSHQAWYTARATDAAEWGIASFTGRSAKAADELAPQDGLYTLIERADNGDTASVIGSIAEAVDGADLARFVGLLAAETTAVVTLTITESGYRLTPAGQPDESDPAVSADLAWLRAACAAGELPAPAHGDGPTTSLGRLVLGLEARRRAGAGPLAIVPCDNIPDNGAFVRGGVLAFAQKAGAATAAWIADAISFVSTSVDRITPHTTPEDLETAARLTGWRDRAPVVCEPFSDWVLEGEFPAGRPAWDAAGARFVADVKPFERRKLWLLNGSHTLLAYCGLLRGYDTVARAVADPELRQWVEEGWDEAARHLTEPGLELEDYRHALVTRFSNRRIAHHLAQIAMEGVSKLRVRAVAIASAERAAGRDGAASARAIAAWIALVQRGEELPDAYAETVRTAASAPPADVPRRLLAVLSPELAADDEFAAVVEGKLAEVR